jgi:hypothetical protein
MYFIYGGCLLTISIYQMYSKRTNENNTKGTIKDDVIDLVTPIDKVRSAEKKYLCPECKDLLQDWPAAKFYNPHSGPSYRCSTCDKIYDSSIHKLPTVINKSKPTMTLPSANNEPMIMFLDEHAGIEKSRG